VAPRGHLRASDADRESVAERLRKASTEGRLTTDELDERLGSALSARTYRELEALVADLPAKRPRARNPAWARPALAAAIVLATIAVLALVALIVTGVFAAWGLWLLFGWFWFGRRHRGYGCARRMHPHPRRSVGPGHFWA